MATKLFRNENLEFFERGKKNKEKDFKGISRYVENLFAQFNETVAKRNKFE